MSTKPILFSTPMVQAILDGRKTMTRRVIKPQPVRNGAFWELGGAGWSGNTVTPVYGHSLYNRMPHKPGDVLWVRETWFRKDCTPDCAGREDENECPFNRVGNACYGYKAQYLTGGDDIIKWRPSIHMPKEAARIFLRVKDVRVERVQDIPEADAEREGIRVECGPLTSCPSCNLNEFKKLWDARNAKRGFGWDTNCWVWAITFERITEGDGDK